MNNPADDDWLPQRLILIDQSAALVEARSAAFGQFPEVEAHQGDYFQCPADAMVSPANSFGIMDGGVDLAIRDQLGFIVQARIQERIIARHHGELPVGSAEIVETGDGRWKFLICAPTMRIPEPIAYTIHAYLAFRAALVAVEQFNQAAGSKVINSLVCCGLGTGIGAMSATRCAAQMQIAYRSMLCPPLIGRFESIHQLHRALQLT